MEYEKLPDEELVLYVQRNEGKGFETIIDRYQTKLLRYVKTMCKDPESAEDIVQETFISAYQNINSFDVRRKFSSWIYRIAHNKAINEIRKNKNKISIDEIAEVASPHDSGVLSNKIDQKQAREVLEKIIDTLSERYRGPLILRFFEEKTYEEISDILQLTVSTVGVRIKRGTAKIKTLSNLKLEDYL